MMTLHWLDLTIIFLFLAGTLGIGFWLAKRASQSVKAYFLASNDLPWYALGLSNASGMFDISGTMFTVAILFIYGLKSAWIPWLWPVWNQIFMMVFLAAWLRRSGVTTGAEWITFRFGEGRGARLAHGVVVVFAVITVIAFMGYFVEGIGKFAVTFLHWDLSVPAIGLANEDAYALLIIAITTLYSVKGGFYSVVGTEILQFIIMTISCLVVAFIAMWVTDPAILAANLPAGWYDLWVGWKLQLDWSQILPSANAQIEKDGYGLFGMLMTLMIFKGVWASLAGPVPSYDMQRVLSARSPSDAARMFGLTPIVLTLPRYLMIAGFGALAVAFYIPELAKMGDKVDFEQVLPFAINNYIPIGWKGLLLAGLLAAFMSTYSAFLNAGPAYLVNDLYKKYINPNAPEKTYVRMSYWASASVVIVGIAFGFVGGSIQQMTEWIVGSLYGGYAAANALKWIWWRFNGYGYFAGMLAGLVGVVIIPPFFPDWSPMEQFVPLLAFSLLGSIIGCLVTPEDDREAVKNFYKKTRPWGFWGPIRQEVMAENPAFRPNSDFRRDLVNVVAGIAWQMCLVILPIYFVFKNWSGFGWSLLVLVVTSAFLWFNWWKKLED